MRILIIQPWIKQGGAELIAVQTAYQLQKLGHQLRLAALFVDTGKMDSIAQKISYVMPSRWISNLCQRSKIFLYFAGPFFLFWLTLKNASWADILFPHSLPAYWIAPVVGRFYRKRVVWLCNEPPKRRGINEVGFVDWLMWFIADSFLDGFFVRQIEKIIVYSNGVAWEVRKRYGKRARVIRLGIDFDFFSKTDKKEVIKLKSKYHLEDKFILLMVGKLHPQKNQRLAIKVLAKILPKIKDAVLVLVGEGPDKKNLELRVSSFQLQDRVIFAGFCSPEVVRAWYSVADLVLFPSVGQTAMVSQSWGFVPFEALCQKKISVVSQGSGAAEILEKEKIGVVCRLGVEDYSKAVLDFFKNKKEYKKTVMKRFNYVKNNLPWERWGKEIEKWIREKGN
jgi:glycosyltransferase involved in cell wall biosynthesis